ncbi:hypothetical protein [uncultured Parabacteroides sp.]|jgi:hypothetical protein|uniref:hypothetical protein n=1 Tax=uncultured Parabacteroides sp. TaxID=512312 RepID=UPI0025DD8494|nr:hypothetical protein [uncultured Parabacteroides sp.]
MKTLVLSMISIAATVAAMTACTSESNEIDDITKNAKVEINATAGIGEIITKTAGVVNQGEAMDDIGFVRVDKADVISDWATETLSDIPATMVAGGAITFTPTQYFDSQKTVYTNMIGYHPKASFTRTQNTIAYQITGQEDIMCTDPVRTNKEAVNMSFGFEHLLTQFSFLIKAENAEVAKAWGNVESIDLINQKTNATLTLDTKDLVFKTPATGTISVGSTATPFKANDVTQTVPFGSPIMVEAGLSEYKVNVKTANNLTGVDITLSVTNAVVSTSYVITLTFQGTTIVPAATIGEWKQETGTGEVK